VKTTADTSVLVAAFASDENWGGEEISRCSLRLCGSSEKRLPASWGDGREGEQATIAATDAAMTARFRTEEVTGPPYDTIPLAPAASSRDSRVPAPRVPRVTSS
jgi:hypothetical protein